MIILRELSLDNVAKLIIANKDDVALNEVKQLPFSDNLLYLIVSTLDQLLKEEYSKIIEDKELLEFEHKLDDDERHMLNTRSNLIKKKYESRLNNFVSYFLDQGFSIPNKEEIRLS